MNIKRSINIALAKEDKDKSWLLEQLGMKQPQLSALIKANKANTATINRIAVVFNMKLSEFIALGEE